MKTTKANESKNKEVSAQDAMMESVLEILKQQRSVPQAVQDKRARLLCALTKAVAKK